MPSLTAESGSVAIVGSGGATWPISWPLTWSDGVKLYHNRALALEGESFSITGTAVTLTYEVIIVGTGVVLATFTARLPGATLAAR
jgi:hypothetical protein